MKKIMFFLTFVFFLSNYSFGREVKIISLNGNVAVRHGIQEEWVSAAVGDILKPDDSIESGKNSSITLLVDGRTKITIPESVIIDISDLRVVTQDELLLKIAMESIRAIPRDKSDDELYIPRITTVHGENRGSVSNKITLSTEIGLKQLKGSKILFDNKYYATSILRAKEVFRIYPELKTKTEFHLMVAEAFEKLNLLEEALNEYLNLFNEELSPKEKKFVAEKIESLKKENE